MKATSLRSGAPTQWGTAAFASYFLHFLLFWTSGPIIGQEGQHPIAVLIFFTGWLLGFIGGVSAIIGLFRDKKKWVSALAILLLPLAVIVTV